MKMYKFIMVSLSVILIMGILVSCGKESSNTEEYKYGVVFTTIEKEKSIISTYSQEGKHLFNKEINVVSIIHDENGSKESFAKIYILNKENLNVINLI